MPLNLTHFHQFIVTPTLHKLGIDSAAFAQLVTGTALTESNLQHLRQMPSGPAKGLYQMEQRTHDDIWQNFLKFREPLAAKVAGFIIIDTPLQEQLYGNFYYSTAMCAVHYLRYMKTIPKYNDINHMASLWKAHYNTKIGKGKEIDFINRARAIMDIK
jgi:hypothetical protein